MKPKKTKATKRIKHGTCPFTGIVDCIEIQKISKDWSCNQIADWLSNQIIIICKPVLDPREKEKRCREQLLHVLIAVQNNAHTLALKSFIES